MRAFFQPNMFAPPLDACLQALHTLRWETTEADWHPAPLTLKKIAVSPSAVCRFPFLHASALYPSNSTKQMFYGWMEIWNGTDGFPTFLSPTTRVQGLANTLKCTYCWGTTHTRCTIHHHCLITSRHRKKNFYSELIKRVSTNEELYLIFYVDWVL